MIVSIVLAAGTSTRFGLNKLLYSFDGKPIVRRSVEEVLNSSVDRVVVVTGYMRELVEKSIADLDVEIVYNPNYSSGMSSSVRAGVNYVLEKHGGASAIVFTPSDCAWISARTYDQIVEYFRERTIVRPAILVASYHGVRGHPVLFSGELLEDLRGVSEESLGLKGVIDRYKHFVRVVETLDPGVVLDLDTFNDLNRVKYYAKK